jgi:hypothetical protein
MKPGLAAGLCVSIPHSGLHLPPGILPGSLCENFADLVQMSNDFCSDALYDFRDLLGNRQVVFPYTPAVLNANRSPQVLDHAAPLAIRGLPVYRPGQEPSPALRQRLVQRYHLGYHRRLQRTPKLFILDGHTTMDGDPDGDDGVVQEDIILDDRQHSELDPPGGMRSAPEGYLDTYANELVKRLPHNIHVHRNNRYLSVYGHVMAAHGWDGSGERRGRAPLLLQETNERLYLRSGYPDLAALNELRRIFAESLSAMLERMALQ